MFKRKFAFLLTALFLAAPSAQAGVYIEPYLGYLTGKTKGSESTDHAGPNFGARLGYSMLGLAFGAEYETAKLKLDSTPKSDITPTNIGAFVSYTFPILVRAYASYFPSAKAKLEVGTSSFEFEGSAMKVGVGYTGLPFVVINFEMQTTSFDKLEGLSLSEDTKVTSYGVNVSLPFSF